MATISDGHSINSQQVEAALLAAFEIKRPVFLWGPPGIGKSEVVAEVAKKLNGHVIDLRMAQMEPTDLRGIPFYNKELNRMDWAHPIDLPDAELASQYSLIVLFLDEMNSAPPSVQAAGYQLVLNRRVGKYVLPDNVVIVAAGNRESDKGVTYRMPMPLANRFIHVEMRVDFDSWQNWAVRNHVHRDVVGFINFSKQDLNDFDPKSSSRAFATPRSWTFVSDILNMKLDSDTQYNLIAGAVGEGLATKFTAHRKIASKMPNPMDILTGKITELEIREPSAAYSLGVGMNYELQEMADMAFKAEGADRKTLITKLHEMADNFLAFCMRNFDTEMIIAITRMALTTHGLNKRLDLLKLKTFDEFSDKFKNYINSK